MTMTESASKPEQLGLTTPVQFIRGVGPQRAELLQKLGIRTAQDALFCFPRDYEFPPPETKIEQLAEGIDCSIVARIAEVDQRVSPAGKSITGVLVEDATGSARLLFFNQPFRGDSLQRGQRFVISGKPKLSGLRFEFVHPRLVPLEEDEAYASHDILPVYSLTEGIKQAAMRRLTQTVVNELAEEIPEVLPESMRTSCKLEGIAETLRNIHQPPDRDALESAHRRLVFQELLVQQLALALRRRKLTFALKSPPLPPSPEIDAAIERRFPFTLTGDQKRAIEQVGEDMARQFPMNRLIQGDVGSGKTVIAQYAMLLAVAHHHQAVLMAPTDVLARQHTGTFAKALANSRVRIGQLSGSSKPSERKETLRALQSGEINLLIGTQALLYDQIEIPKLGLVVIDEQHKFGVHQRARLRGDGLDPHYLVLSATPIPRTVAMTLYGDLEVSVLKEKPPGRGRVKTYLAKNDWRERWWSFVGEKLREGRQAFVVTPLVSADSSDEEAHTVSNAEQVFHELKNGPLASFRVGLLHGRLSSEQKHAVMRQFAEGRLQVLVSTSVIEVGIDVPNATVLTVLGAERFGLAQLHQLRGRVSRGKHTGHVGIFTDGPQAPEENERLQALADTDDGFAIAEADFRMRGPGDLLGTRQSGLPPLRIADLVRDAGILQEARGYAQSLVEDDPELEAEALQLLKAQVLRRYEAVLALGDVA